MKRELMCDFFYIFGFEKKNDIFKFQLDLKPKKVIMDQKQVFAVNQKRTWHYLRDARTISKILDRFTIALESKGLQVQWLSTSRRSQSESRSLEHFHPDFVIHKRRRWEKDGEYKSS